VQGKKEFRQRIYYNINLDSLVPEDHLLKRLEKLVSFDFVRNITRDYYSHTGKPSIDPAVLVKMLLIGYLFDIRSERKLVEEISLNLAYRWYIDYDLDEEIPNHSIFSKARARFEKKLFLDIFEKILVKCIELGLVSREGMLIDSTIVKADASSNSLVEINLSPEEYWKRLDRPERPKKKLVGERFTGKVDKNKSKNIGNGIKGLLKGGVVAVVAIIFGILMVYGFGGYLAAVGLGFAIGGDFAFLTIVVLAIARLFMKGKKIRVRPKA